MPTKKFSCKIEELPSVAEWCSSLLKNKQAEFKDYLPDFGDPYPEKLNAKIVVVRDLITTKLFLGEVSVITKKLYDNMDAARPWLLKLEGYIERAEDTLETPAKNFDIKGVRNSIRGRDSEGLGKNLISLLQIVDKNTAQLVAKGMKPELVTALNTIMVNNAKFEKEQNEKMLVKEKAVKDNMDILNDLWKDCQNIMDAGKRINKFSDPEMVKNFTMAHIKKVINHTSKGNADKKDEGSNV